MATPLIVCVEDYEPLARERLPNPVWDYIDGGAGAELTLNANREAFDRATLRPRVLVDVSHCDTTTTVLGSPLGTPVLVAPTAYHGQVHPDAEEATARAAGAAGSLFAASMLASRTPEEIAQAAIGPLWFQLYWLRNRDVVADLVTRAQTAGYRAIVLTVDAPQIGRRLRDLRNGFAVDPRARARGLDVALTGRATSRTKGSREWPPRRRRSSISRSRGLIWPGCGA